MPPLAALGLHFDGEVPLQLELLRPVASLHLYRHPDDVHVRFVGVLENGALLHDDVGLTFHDFDLFPANSLVASELVVVGHPGIIFTSPFMAPVPPFPDQGLSALFALAASLSAACTLRPKAPQLPPH